MSIFLVAIVNFSNYGLGIESPIIYAILGGLTTLTGIAWIFRPEDDDDIDGAI